MARLDQSASIEASSRKQKGFGQGLPQTCASELVANLASRQILHQERLRSSQRPPSWAGVGECMEMIPSESLAYRGFTLPR